MTYATPTAPAPAPAVAAPAKIKPGRIWYWIGALLIAAGVVGAISLIIAGIVGMSRTVDDFARFEAPVQGQTLDFAKSGTYTIYYEHESEIDGVEISSPEDIPGDLDIQVTTEDGTPVPVSGAGTSVSFSVSGKAGEAVNKVTIPAPGTYIMNVSADSLRTEPCDVESGDTQDCFAIAIGKGVLGRLFAYLGAAGIVGFLGFVAGLVIIIVTAVKRSRRRKERRLADQEAARQSAWAAEPVTAGAPGWPPAAPAPGLLPAPAPGPTVAPPTGPLPPPAEGGGGWAPPPPPRP
jgi:hypothetical protein